MTKEFSGAAELRAAEQESAETQSVGAKSKLTRADQSARLMPALLKLMPRIHTVAQLYHNTYPVDKTAPEVVDAVTVAVPLRDFMIMTAYCSNAVAEHIERSKPEGQAKQDGSATEA